MPPQLIQLQQLKKDFMTDQLPKPETDTTGVTGPIPDDFPRDPFPAAVPGAQPKFVARKIDGRYVVGLTAEERRERYVACLDLVEQLAPYTEKKHRQRPELTMAELLDVFDRDIRLKDWGLGDVELDWVMKQLRARFI